jgi:type II restriction enzyme
LFQLKSKSSAIGDRIVDAGYQAMMKAIEEDRTPNLYVLHYNRQSWQVENLILIPQFAFSASAVEARKPLSPTARRAGWIGCFIVLKNIPPDARIPIIAEGQLTPQDEVRDRFRHLMPLKELSIADHGWTLDVLTAVRKIGKRVFTNQDAYEMAPELEQLHPNNKHVKDKIRQQLQRLRDQGFINQKGRGVWELNA